MALCAAIVLFLSFAAANAYRVAEAAYVAPFEYAAVPLSIFWGGIIWGDWPDLYGYIGTLMIVGAGLLIILRERQEGRGCCDQHTNVVVVGIFSVGGR